MRDRISTTASCVDEAVILPSVSKSMIANFKDIDSFKLCWHHVNKGLSDVEPTCYT